MPLQKITFFILSAVALGSAILVITRRNAVHCAMWLVVTLFSVGGIFLTLHAEFLFAVQVILYVGGIMVLFLFVIMLVNLDVAAKQMQFSRQWLLGDRKSTRLNSSHVAISYAVFCLKKKIM